MYLGMKYDFLDRSMYQNEFVRRIRKHFEKQNIQFNLDDDVELLFNLDYLLQSDIRKSQFYDLVKKQKPVDDKDHDKASMLQYFEAYGQ